METLLAKPHDGNLGVSPYCKVLQCNTTAKELDFHRVILLENESSVYSSLSDPTQQITHGKRALRSNAVLQTWPARGDPWLGSLVQLWHRVHDTHVLTVLLERAQELRSHHYWLTAQGNEHQIAQLLIQLPAKGEASSSVASIYAKEPQHQFKQKSAVGYLQE